MKKLYTTLDLAKEMKISMQMVHNHINKKRILYTYYSIYKSKKALFFSEEEFKMIIKKYNKYKSNRKKFNEKFV